MAAAILGHTGFLGVSTGLGLSLVAVVAKAAEKVPAVSAATAAGGALLFLPVFVTLTKEGVNAGTAAIAGSRRVA